ncbi:hypothetical protein [Marivivens aquimaris]|uniref:hypothetical protein n=1 Tax=Marivivens aquimaris TaxID=2774876 RepID=UPI00187E7918|nr:hypothetical protein [Marivivens aquimaris]
MIEQPDWKPENLDCKCLLCGENEAVGKFNGEEVCTYCSNDRFATHWEEQARWHDERADKAQQKLDAINAPSEASLRVITDISNKRNSFLTGGFWGRMSGNRFDNGELSKAAACYALQAAEGHYDRAQWAMPIFWPFHPTQWRPETRRNDLLTAAALLVWEIERADTTPANEIKFKALS